MSAELTTWAWGVIPPHSQWERPGEGSHAAPASRLYPLLASGEEGYCVGTILSPP
jgi:hypothetical protein